MLRFIGVLLLAVVSETIWVVWSRGIDTRREGVVALSGMTLMLVGLITINAAVDDHLLYIPAILGTGAGAIVGMRLPLGWLSGAEDNVPDGDQDS